MFCLTWLQVMFALHDANEKKYGHFPSKQIHVCSLFLSLVSDYLQVQGYVYRFVMRNKDNLSFGGKTNQHFTIISFYAILTMSFCITIFSPCFYTLLALFHIKIREHYQFSSVMSFCDKRTILSVLGIYNISYTSYLLKGLMTVTLLHSTSLI